MRNLMINNKPMNLMKHLLKTTLLLIFLVATLDAAAGYVLVGIGDLSYDCSYTGYGSEVSDLMAVVRVSDSHLDITTAIIAPSVSFEYHYYEGNDPNLHSVILTAPVVAIKSNGFSGRKQLTSVTIPNTITSIGYYAFSGCENLTNFTIPESVTSIETHAFAGCVSLTRMDIPDLVTYIGNGLFNACTNLKSVTVPYLSSSMFLNCISLTSVTISNDITIIPDNCFAGCSSLPGFTIPNTVTSIEGHAFNGCSSFTSITIPGSVTAIGNYAFRGCDNLTSVTCLAVTPPSVSWDTFQNYKNATLYVPAGSVDIYKSTYEWNRFFTIQPISETLPGDVNGDGELNIGDVNAVIHTILYGTDGTDADVNGDGEVNIADVTALIKLIFEKENS